MDDRLPLADAVHPDPRLIYRVMESSTEGLAHMPGGVRGPGLQTQVDLVRLHKMVEAHRAAGKFFGFVKGGTQHLRQRMRTGRLHDAQAGRQHRVIPPHRRFGLLACGDIHHHEAALLPLFGGVGLDMHLPRGVRFVEQRHLAAPVRLACQDFLQQGFESGLVGLGYENAQLPAHQPGAFRPQQGRPGQVDHADMPAAVQRRVAYRRKVIQIGVPLQTRFHLRPRPP